ncbi:MAG: hypothetical protein HYR75_03065 [Gemmatimonadetes bacterium]|nr:hypothetical protein [Gemmatimonadota bacterium]MBI3567247.1 hypothetical protein [Gemmatimonadota bacterium]
MTMRSTAAYVAAAMLVLAASASAQDARLSLIRDDATRDAVRAQLRSATSRGLPADPFMSKALEGVAKKASTKSIRAAMAALEKRMRAAHAALAPSSDVDELAAGADALSVGVPEKALKQLRATAPGRSISVELGVLTELVARGVPVKQATKAVLDLMARGATGVQLTALGRDVQGDVAAGLKPDVALDLRGRNVLSLLPPPPTVSNVNVRPR